MTRVRFCRNVPAIQHYIRGRFLTISVGRLGLCTLALAAASACSGGASSAGSMLPQNATIPIGESGTSPIQHIIVIVQENRSFNNLFAQFPNATGTITGKEKIGKGKNIKVVSIPLAEVP